MGAGGVRYEGKAGEAGPNFQIDQISEFFSKLLLSPVLDVKPTFHRVNLVKRGRKIADSALCAFC